MIAHLAASPQAPTVLLAGRAFLVIDRAFRDALSLMTDINEPEAYFRTDYRVLDAVLTLGTLGYTHDSLKSLDPIYRLTSHQWESLLVHAIGGELLKLSKAARK